MHKAFFLTIAVTVALLALLVLAMGFKALFVKGGQFPNQHFCQRHPAKKTPGPEVAEDKAQNDNK